jgi:acyl-CoA reductase-like NAD-dependent aldehyde dehydrogenase
MNNKKINKSLAHAEMTFQKEQLKAAMMQEQLDKAIAIIDQHKQELSETEYADAQKNLEQRRAEVKDFLIKATEKYAKKLQILGDPKIDFETDEVI